MRNRLLLATVLIPGAMILSCQFGCHPNSMEESRSERGYHFVITVSSGGGFTGAYSGYRVYSDGRIERWQGFGPQQDSLLWSRWEDRTVVKTLGSQFRTNGVFKVRWNKNSNMTSSLSYADDDSTYSWSWEFGAMEELPASLIECYESVNALCADVEKRK